MCATLGQTEKGTTGNEGMILDAMLAVDGESGKYPEFKGNVATVYTHPLSQGGQDRWVNVVTACKRCNNHKAGRTPEQAGMELLAIPFCPTHAEYVYLQGRQILNDQMDFLLAHFPRNSVLRKRVEKGEPLLM